MDKSSQHENDFSVKLLGFLNQDEKKLEIYKKINSHGNTV